MKKLLITLLLISPLSFADWGDVYYCQMTTLSETSFEGKRTDYVLQKFQFKLDKTGHTFENAVVFGKNGYFKDIAMEIEGMTRALGPALEKWHATGINNVYRPFYHSEIYFEKGKFLYVKTGSAGSYTITADCDKF